MADYIPHKDADLLSFASNMSTKITATPVAFGLLVADDTNLAKLLTAFSPDLPLAPPPGTRTAVSVASKDTARVALVPDIRSLAKRVQATPTVTAVRVP